MQLNNVIKRIMLVSLIVMISACSRYYKITHNSDEFAIGSNDNNIVNTTNLNQDHLLIHWLQSNNIIYFDLDKYNINPEFAHILDKHANFLSKNLSCKVTIEGHADERGTPEYNIALGERRANAVKMYLQSKGVLADQLNIISYGKEKPAVLGHNELAYTKNRRAVLIY